MSESQVEISKEWTIPISELQFRTSRSGGPGGQNVNKLETRVELLFDLVRSPFVPDHLRQRLCIQLAAKLDSAGILRIVAQESRSQWKNKHLAIDKLVALLKSGLVVHKKRIATKPKKSSHELRLRRKKLHGETKRLRKSIID